MPSFFRKNPNLNQELEGEPPFPNALAAAANPAAEAAKSFAPVQTGAYRDGIKVIVRGKEVFVSATDFKSHWIEWGSAHNPPSAPLRRGVRAAGLRFEESSK